MKKIVSFIIFMGLLFSQSLMIESRTIGGEIIQENDKSKPWLVNFNNKCSASLINEKFILTAFHCIYTDTVETLKKEYIIKARGSETVSKIKNVYLPYKDTFVNKMSDVAVIELSEAIKIDSYIKVPSEDFLDKYYGKQDVSLLLGYGANDIDAAPFVQPTQLKLSIMNRESCNQLILKNERTPIEDSLNYFICDDAKADTKRKGKDIGMCAGDSGGPLTIKENGEFYQIGTVSGYSQDGGSDNCGKNSAFYGSMAHHSKWINKVLTKSIEPINSYEVIDASIEGYFYNSMKNRVKKTWVLWGAPSKLNFDTAKMPSEFSIFVYRDKKFIAYTETSESIKINRLEGFWYYSK